MATPQGISAEPQFHSVVGANFQICGEQIKNFIKENKITREQIISISAHEEGVNDGTDDPDVELVLYYSNDAPVNASHLDDLEFHLYKATSLWDNLEQ